MAKKRTPETLVQHPSAKRGHGPLVEPIYSVSTWRLESAAQGAAFARATAPHEYYTRWGNPTIRDLEDVLGKLEGGAGAIATASGMGAIASALLTFIRTGEHIVAGRGLYAATTEILTRLFPRLGIDVTFVDPTVPGAWGEAVRENTSFVFVETPANPTMEITDIGEAVRAARSVGAVVFADNTFATPINQRPIERGVDVVLHSMTKYLGGHSDVVAGCIVPRTRGQLGRLWYTYKLLGPTLGPFEAFLVRRGIRTLPLRMRQHNRTAAALAGFLEDHPVVSRVYYPGLKSFPQHRLARRQMNGFGGMLSFDLKGGYAAGRRFVESVRVATLAVSLGGPETLVQHPASMTHGTLTAKERAAAGIRDDLVRVSTGLEDADDLIEDFDAALRRAARRKPRRRRR